MINFAGGIVLLGGGNLTRSDFDFSENCYLVWEGDGGGDQLLVGGGESTGGGNISWWGGGNEQICG